MISSQPHAYLFYVDRLRSGGSDRTIEHRGKLDCPLGEEHLGRTCVVSIPIDHYEKSTIPASRHEQQTGPSHIQLDGEGERLLLWLGYASCVGGSCVAC